jgi:hypothetical protein
VEHVHWCETCYRPVEQHPDECERGCTHWPPLCCPGCACQSFEEAEHEETVLCDLTVCALLLKSDHYHVAEHVASKAMVDDLGWPEVLRIVAAK